MFTSKIAIHDWPGANLHRQLLFELLHCEAQGTIGVHFELFSVKLERLWDAQGYPEKALWRAMTQTTYNYCRDNHIESLPKFPTWLYWKHALSGGDKLRFFHHCPAILAPLLTRDASSIKEHWQALVRHSKISQRLCHRVMDRDELDSLESEMKLLHSELLTLYPDSATLNTHYETHLVTNIRRYIFMCYTDSL